MSQTGLHVVHIVEAFGGGISTYLRLVLPQLAKQGVAITLIYSDRRNCPSMPMTLAILRQHGIVLQRIPMIRSIHPLVDMMALFRLVFILWQGRFDVVHTHGSKAGALGRFAGWLVGVNIRLHTPHCFAHLRCRSNVARFVYLLIERLLGKITTTLLAVSPSEAAEAIEQNIVALDQCIVVPNALPDQENQSSSADSLQMRLLKKTLGLAETTFVVTTITRCGFGKGLQLFLDIAAAWQEPNTLFLIVGDCQSSKTKNISLPNVRWLGFCHEMEAIYQLSDVVVLASNAEGQSYALLEAMQAGCAILATRVPGNEDLIDHGRTGLLADVDSISLTQTLHQLYTAPSFRRQLGANAYHYIHRHHALEGQVSRLISIYNTLNLPNMQRVPCR